MLRCFTIGRDAELRDWQDKFLELYGIDDDGAVLVRPDGFVAWRQKNGAGAQPGKIKQVLRSLLTD